ncbi:hypothetical protein EJ08DRAFT_577802 [Tothia fuscella]|uniref:Inositolphosphotransferase Aur1/Ipt1 domain-containing protein n=1 Tax=Tothia fuscella TaxID=1048955 RepID=A0A9P4U4T6_9PEZI|nr:hypothetical protein EJ08DRAFT_577802 [Tothia fuscella]
MGGIKDVLEPGLIVLTFALGVSINRRPFRSSARDDELRSLLGDESSSAIKQLNDPAWIQKLLPDNSRFRKNIISRILAAFPFLIEIGYWNLMYWIYQLARAYSAVKIRNNDAVYDKSRSHAVSILSMERSVHLNMEQPIQRWVREHFSSLFRLLTLIYYSHIVLLVAFIVYTYTYYPRKVFQQIRRTLAGCNLIAFIVMTAFRVMPPRMLPEKYGFVDIFHPKHGEPGSSWTNNKYQLTIAAMPSLHFGTAALISFSIIRWSPHAPLRFVAIFWPFAMLFTILATANHYILDAAVGALVPVVAWCINDGFLILRPLEEWMYWICRTEKPLAADEDPPRMTEVENDSDHQHSRQRLEGQDIDGPG